MKNPLIFCFSLIILISCNKEKALEPQFELIGKTSFLENGEKVYLEYNLEQEFEDRIIIDSTVIENNSFQFTTKLPHSTLQSVIYTKDYKDAKKIWLENNEILFDASNSVFRNAIVTGSETQNLASNIDSLSYSMTDEQVDSLKLSFIKNHPKSTLSAFYLSKNITGIKKQDVINLYNSFSDSVKQSEYGQLIAQFIELNKNLKIGDNFVDFEMESPNSEKIKLSDFKGKVLLLDFWASWCGGCRKTHPDLVKVYNEYKDKGFEIISISLDNKKDNWIKAIEQDSLTWIHLSDLKGTHNLAKLAYGISAVPDNYLVDVNGKIISRNLNPKELKIKLSEIMSAANTVYN
ncbi:TlpA disulfide reductase family protein [Mangrovimonas xylaniphaga]|uniref:TlpA disulfide reductase family protein n=1 Tax=Mangrovimonas xylaniphaga TaxID=1645915 RepID=UPI0006B425EE|nr:TlpA disulfide reductase family protein [Mangrovimonas xylaniphaga]